METVRKLLRNWWFCLGMAVINLLFMVQSILDGTTVWISVVGVVAWTYLAHRNSRQQHTEVKLTTEQVAEIRVITRRFSREVDAILKEADDNESNRGKDQEEDKGESSDE